MAFADETTEVLLTIRRNLLAGLDQVAAHLDAETFTAVGAKGSAPPSQSGQLTLLLLHGVDAELATRKAPNVTQPKPRTILVDVDGTVAIRGDRSPYDWNRVGEDTPNPPVIAAVEAMHAAGHRVIYVSGRSEDCRLATAMWLRTHLPNVGLHAELLMRPTGDNRKDSLVKQEIYELHILDQFDVIGVFDDRNQVVAMWRSLGLTVFQVAEGNF